MENECALPRRRLAFTLLRCQKVIVTRVGRQSPHSANGAVTLGIEGRALHEPHRAAHVSGRWGHRHRGGWESCISNRGGQPQTLISGRGLRISEHPVDYRLVNARGRSFGRSACTKYTAYVTSILSTQRSAIGSESAAGTLAGRASDDPASPGRPQLSRAYARGLQARAKGTAPCIFTRPRPHSRPRPSS